MSVTRRLRHRLAADADRESGMTLIELLVAMGLFTILISIFMASVAQMTRSTARVRAATDSSDEVRRAFSRLDKQVRYASAVNRPGLVGSDQYIEFETTAVDVGDVASCTQWRVVASTDTLEVRSWDDVDTGATATPWLVVARGVVNDLTANPAFTFLAVDENHTKQRVAVYLDVRGPTNRGAELRSTFVAINTTTTTTTNDVDTTTGQSRTPVCQQFGRP